MTMPTDVAQPARISRALQFGPAVYAVPFRFIDADDLRVEHLNNASESPIARTVLELGTHYTVQGGNYDVGQVTVLVDLGGAPDLLRITRTTKRLQSSDYRNGDGFDAESHEKALDRMTMIVQELERDKVTESQVRALIKATLQSSEGISVKDVNNDGRDLQLVNNFGAEYVRDRVGEALEAGDGITITPNDAADRIRINCTVVGVEGMADVLLLSGDQQSGGYEPGGGGTFAELVTDLIAASIAVVGLNKAFDDATNTITITNPMTDAGVTALAIAAFTNGEGVVLTPVGAQMGISLAAPLLTVENVRDTIGATLTNAGGIEILIGDDTDTVAIGSDRLAPDYAGLVPIPIAGHFSFDPAHNGRALDVDTTASDLEALLQPQATIALPAGFACVIRNSGPNDILLNKGAGVVLNKNGSQIDAAGIIAPGGVVQIERWAVDEFTASGSKLA